MFLGFCTLLWTVTGFASLKQQPEQNELLRLANVLLDTSNNTDCWMCAHSLYNRYWPLGPFSFVNTSFWANVSIFNDNATASSKQTPRAISLVPNYLWPKAPICIESFNGYVDLGSYPFCNLSIAIPYGAIDWINASSGYGEYAYLPTCPCPDSSCVFTGGTCNILGNSCTSKDLTCIPYTGWPDNVTRYGAHMSLPFQQYLLFRTMQYQCTDIHLGNVSENYTFGLPPGIFFICGHAAYKVLPANWKGRCTLGTLGPYNLYIAQHHNVKHARNPHIYKRALNKTAGIVALDIFGWFVPGLNGLATNAKLELISQNIELLANASKIAIKALQTEIDSLANVVVQHRLGLDFLFLRNGGLCAWLNTSCCFYINKSGVIEQSVLRLQEVMDGLRDDSSDLSWWESLWSWLPGFGWVHSLLMYVIIIAILVVICCFVQCISSFLTMCIQCCKKSSQTVSAKQLYQVRYHALYSYDNDF